MSQQKPSTQAPHGREQELKSSGSTTGAGEVSVPHGKSGDDPDYGVDEPNEVSNDGKRGDNGDNGDHNQTPPIEKPANKSQAF